MAESASLSAGKGDAGSSSPRLQRPTRPARDASPPVTDLIAAACPFLVASDGAWRAAVPAREHRCGATDPPGRLPLEKQQHLCLVASHLDCALFEAAAG